MRTLANLLMLALLATAPVALAQDEEKTNETNERPDDAAWVEDCPPDMMCAYDAGEPQPYGNESCIECSGPVDDGQTCMDGASGNETCRDDVQYIGGEPTRGPSDGSCENCRGPDGAEAQADDTRAVPLPAALIVIAVAAALVFVAMRR